MSNADNHQTTAIGELRQLKLMVEEVDASLRSQREILKRRGLNLPPMVLQTLSAVQTDLEKLESGLVEDQTELGQLRALAETSAMINSSLDLDEVLAQAMDVVINLTDAERGHIILKDPHTGALDFKVTRDNELGGSRRGDGSVQVSNTIINEVIETASPLLADNAYKDERLQGNQSIANLALRSVLCVPLNYRDKVTGVVYVDNRLRSGVFTEREKNLLFSFANQAAVAIENARLFTEIQATLTEITAIKELMSNVFSSIGSGVITTSASDHVVTFNRAAAQILSQEEQEALGKRLRSVLPLINADVDDHLSRVRKESQEEHLEVEMETNQRGRIALNMKLSPLRDPNQQTQGVALVLDDVTDQRQRDEILNAMKRYLPKQLVEKAAELAKLGLGGERREVTCMFADVLPLTFFRNVPPTQLMEMLNRYLAVTTECVHKTTGVIDKYMGNEVMILFNSQLNPMDNHALQCVEAGLLMAEAFKQLYPQMGLDPDKPFFRIGLHTGVATLGNVGSLNRRDFSAIGDTINLAHRILENAAEGQVLISEETLQSITHNLNGQPLPIRVEGPRAIQVKGREKAVNIYEVFRA